MSRNNGTTPRAKKHSSRSNFASKQCRIAFHKLLETSSLSSNRNSSTQSEDGIQIFKNTAKKTNDEDKDSLLKKLATQVKELKHKIKVLEECVDNKDYSLAVLTREKDRALGEIRRLERSNRQLRQQLNDERSYYIEEKEKFCEEMTKHKKRFQKLKIAGENSKSLSDSLPVIGKTRATTWQKGDALEIRSTKGFLPKMPHFDNFDYPKSHSLINLNPHNRQDLTLQLAALQMENAKLRDLVSDGEEKNYELCLRFLRMKHSKRDLRIRFQDLENEYLQIINNLMEKIDEAREEFNVVVDQRYRRPIHSSNATVVRAISRNSKIAIDSDCIRIGENQRGKRLKERAQRLTDEAFNAKNSNGDHESFSTSETEKRLADVKSNVSIGSEVVNLGLNENLTQKSSGGGSGYMTKSYAFGYGTGNAQVKSTDIILGDFERRSVVTDRAVNTKIHMLSEDILNKIFKRIDSQLSARTGKETQNGSVTRRKVAENLKDGKSFHDPDHLSDGKCSGFEKNFGKKFIMCCMNSNKFHEITRPIAKKKDLTPNSSGKTEERRFTCESLKLKKKPDKLGKCKTDMIGLAWDGRIRARWKTKPKGCCMDVKESFRSRQCPGKSQIPGKEVGKIEAGSGWSHISESSSTGRESISNFDRISSSPVLLASTEDAVKRENIYDSCGLQEKLDSDFDISADHKNTRSARNESGENGDGRRAIVAKPFATSISRKCNTPEEDGERLPCHEAPSKDELASNSIDSTSLEKSSSTSGNRNSITLYDELMEVSRTQIQSEDDPFWQRAWNLQPVIAKNAESPPKRYWVTHQHSAFLSEGIQQQNPGFVENSDEEVGLCRRIVEEDTRRLQKGSERQSKWMENRRLKSRSPTMAHRKVARVSSKNESYAKGETLLRFLMEQSAIESSQSLSLGRDESRCNSQTFRSDKDKPSPPQQQAMQSQVSHLGLPQSNIPSSCSTMVDSSGGRNDGLASRVLSAPALLESEWLNTFEMCEMKDCSTNT